MSLPNCLTFSRIFISPLFMVIYLKGHWFGINHILLPYILLIILTVSELTDAVDGYIARKFSQVTDLGKLLDPMADSIYRISLYLTFTQPPINIPLITVFIFLARDSVISTLRTICALRGYALAARNSGKLKAILQGVSFYVLLLAMIPHSLGFISSSLLELISGIFSFSVALYSLISMVEYFWANKVSIMKALNTKPEN